MNILTKFVETVLSGALILATTIGGLLTPEQKQVVNTPIEQVTEKVALGGYYTAAGGTYRLQTSIGSTDTTIRLSSFKDPRNDVPMTMAYLNTSIAYGTLDPQQSSRSELVSFTGITQNSDGTASLTGVTRGLLGVYPYTASSTLRKTHAGQSIFILSDAPQVFNEYAAKQNNETITGSWSFGSTTFTGLVTVPSISTTTFTGPVTFNASTTYNAFSYFNASSTFNATTSFNEYLSSNYTCTGASALTSLCNKQYIDGVATSGAPNASSIQKGVVQEATVAQIDSASSTGSTGARLYINPSILASSTIITSQFATTTTVYPIPQASTNGTNGVVVSSSTGGFIGLVSIPQRIVANSLTIAHDAPTTAGVVSFSLFSSNGQARLFVATSTISGSSANKKVTFASAATIPAGMYYVVALADSAFNGSIYTWSSNTSLVTAPSGEPKNSGFIASTTMPTSFNPVFGISTTSAATIPYFRLDE